MTSMISITSMTRGECHSCGHYTAITTNYRMCAVCLDSTLEHIAETVTLRDQPPLPGAAKVSGTCLTHGSCGPPPGGAGRG
jgi:hypothetical protein